MSSYLTSDQEKELHKAHDRERESRYSDRIKAILYLHRGMDYEEVGELLLCHTRSIRRYEQLYLDGGLEALLSDRRGGSSGKLNEEQKLELKAHLRGKVYRRSKEIKEHIKPEYGVEYSISGVHCLLAQLGFVYKKPKVSLAKANPEKQEEFLDKIEDIQEGMSAGEKLYHVDGVHFQFATEVSFGWIERGTTKELPAHPGRRRVNVHGALDIETDQIIALCEETLNADSFIRFLKELESINPEAARIHIVLDNARYHRNKKVKEYLQQSRIELHFLPPYSPNLNLIERVWGFTKRTLIYNQYFDDYHQFKESIIHFLKSLHLHYRDEMLTLLEHNFHIPLQRVNNV